MCQVQHKPAISTIVSMGAPVQPHVGTYGAHCLSLHALGVCHLETQCTLGTRLRFVEIPGAVRGRLAPLGEGACRQQAGIIAGKGHDSECQHTAGWNLI
jgi:hypothetical protein